MTTVEKLVVQIFERRNSIIEQVKQQKELYSQHLASKLLIDGITPPSWLWSPNTSSSSNELNKEEVLSKLLRPYPKPSARCSVAYYPAYDNLFPRGDNEEFSDGDFMENLDFTRGFNGQDHLTAPPLSGEDRADCALDSVPEPDASVTSPEDETDERIVNIYSAPDQSLARIQRSKSRQKALQLRNSATSLAKSSVSRENIRDVSSSNIKFSLSATSQAGQNDELLILAEPCVTGSQSCADWDDKADGRSKEKEKSADAGRITRSRSNIKAPDFVRGSLTLGCSPENCKEGASHISEVRRTHSMHISDSHQNDNYVNKLPKSAGPSTVNRQSCGDTQANGTDCLINDMDTDVFAGRITGSNISSKGQSCGRDSSKADISSDEYQRIDAVMMDSRDDLQPESVSLLYPPNVLNEGCDARESVSGDCQSHRSRGSIPYCSFNQQNANVDEVSHTEICSHSAKADGVILAPLSGISAQEVNDSMVAHGFSKPSVGLFCRMTRSQSRSNLKELYEPVAYNENSSLKGTMSKSDFKQKAAANDEIQSTSGCQFGPSCNETHDMIDEHENASFFMVNKLVLSDHVDQSVSNSSSDAKQRRELELEVAPTASNSLVHVEPKQLNFNGFEESNLKASTSNSGKRRLDNSPEKMRCSFLDPAVSLEKGISVGINQLSFRKQSSGMSEENPVNQAEESGPLIIGTLLYNSGKKTEAGLNHKISDVYCEADSTSKMVDMPGVQIHPKQHIEEGDGSGEGNHEIQLVSNALGSENLRASEDKKRLVSYTPGSVNLRASNDMSQLVSPTPEIVILGASKDKSQLVSNTPGSENLRSSEDKSQLVSNTPGSEDLRGSEDESHLVSSTPGSGHARASKDRSQSLSCTPGSVILRATKDKSQLISNTPGSENLRSSDDKSQLASNTPGSEDLRGSKDKSPLVSITPGSEHARASKGRSQSVSCTPRSVILRATKDKSQLISNTPGSESLRSSDDNSQLVSNTPGSEDLRGSKDKSPLVPSTPGSENLRSSYDKSQLVSNTPGSEDLRGSNDKSHLVSSTPGSEHAGASKDRGQSVSCTPGSVMLRASNDKSQLVSNTPGSETLRSSDDKSQFVSSTPGSDNLKASEDKSHLVSCTPGSENARASKDKSQSVPCTLGSENVSASHACNSAKQTRAESCDSLIGILGGQNQICDVLDKMKQFHARQSEVSSCHEGGDCSQHRNSPLRDNVFVTYEIVYPHDECSSPRRRFKHAMESWPQLKRRKTEHQQIYSLTTSPSIRARKPVSTQRSPVSTYLKNMEISLDTAVDTFHVDKHTDIEIPPEISNLVEGIECSFSYPNEEVEFCCMEKNEHTFSSPAINNEQLGSALVSSLKKESTNSQGCIIEEMSDTNSQHLCNLEKDTDNLSSANLTLTNAMLEEMQSRKWESGLQAQHSVLSPRTEDLELIDVDQSMPVLEGFIVDAQEDSGELDFAADGIDFEKLKLSSNTIERASILAEICRSASLDKPHSHFSSAFEFQRNQSLYQSLPNVHLEHLDFVSTNSDVGEQLSSGRSSLDDCVESLEGMPFSDGLSYSGARYSWNLRSLHASPVGKLWERLSLHTGSSEKRLSSNPELTCFPIEEDVSISEESKTVDENGGDFQEVDSSLAKHSDKRKPLKDLSNLGLNSPMSVSVPKKTSTAGSGGFSRTKLSVAETQETVLPGKKNEYRNKSEISEEQTSSFGPTDGRKNQTSLQGTNGIKKGKESINGSISKSLLSIKSGLKRQDGKISLKARRNNIVSNVSSFIPLVQQKQAAAVCGAGKRDVKVKALGAAEAAKRLEEKKENERKMRKEALKLERAKVEENNLRQLELEKKRKEVERKKKDADIVAKKRQRDEDERKEKENKRMRLESRHRQREQEEKLRSVKAEKGNQISKGGPMNGKKVIPNESKKQQNREMVGGDDVALIKADTKLTTTEIVMNYEECSTSGQSREVEKAMHAVYTSPKKDDLIVNDSREKSYEISPYLCSDDEDEEEDELPTKKSIPSWASKSSIALLLKLQQEIDPDSIFTPGSFCSMEEVLLPRKLQQKRVT